MITKGTVSTIRQTLIGVFLGGIVSIIPFYFETKAMTLQSSEANLDQDNSIQKLEQSIVVLDRNVAVEKTQREHDSEAIERIEKKLDVLIREVKH